MRNGPDGTLEGKAKEEQPVFVHYACSFYLSGVLAYLEGEDGSKSWRKSSDIHNDFDEFVTNYPEGDLPTYASLQDISRKNLDALAELRNAVMHHDGDLAENNNKKSFDMVKEANFPGVKLNGTVATLEEPFLEYVRLAAVAVRNYYGGG